MQRFERNAAVCGDDAINAAIKGEYTLIMVADNVDHNICTLNGENTFRGMGKVAAISNGCFSSKVLSRRNVTNDEILKVSVVDIHDYKSLKSHESNEKFETLPSLQTYSESSANILWKMSWYFSHPIPSWSGVMEIVYDKQDFPHSG